MADIISCDNIDVDRAAIHFIGKLMFGCIYS